MQRLIDREVEKHVDAIEAAIGEQVREAARDYGSGRIGSFDESNIRDPLESLWRESGPLFAGLLFNAIDNARKDFTEEQMSVWEDAVAQHISESTGRQVRLINDTTREWIQSVIASATSEGMGTDEIAAELRKRWDMLSKTRALRIAQTEMNSAANWGSLEAGKSAGMTRKFWIPAGDARTRPQHAEMGRREPIPIEDDFVFPDGSVLAYPSSPGGPARHVINCRCQVGYLP